jgi:hypothetical protein
VIGDVSESAWLRNLVVLMHPTGSGVIRCECEEGMSMGCAGGHGGEAKHGRGQSERAVVWWHRRAHIGAAVVRAWALHDGVRSRTGREHD